MPRLSTTYPHKRALISGAASGIGEAFALQLAAEGWSVGLCDVNATGLEEAAGKVEAAGGRPLTYCFDVRERAAYKNAIDTFVREAGGIDLLINNAGIGCGGRFHEVPLEDFDTTLGINLMGVVHGLYFAVPHLIKQRSGHIINTASAAAFAAAGGMTAYNASKAAVLALSETLRAELFDYNIRVSCLMPHFIRTNIHKSSIGTQGAKSDTVQLVTEARYGPDELVSYALDRAGRGEFYIIFPKIARRMWNMKRHFPERYFKMALDFTRQLASRAAPK